MNRYICESGRIDKDGKMRLPMDRLRQFFSQNKGRRIVIRVDVWEEPTEAMFGYYHRYIVPTIQKALYEQGQRLAAEEVDEWLRSSNKITCNAEHGLRRVEQLSRDEMSEFISWLKEFAAENLYTYIEDPKTL